MADSECRTGRSFPGFHLSTSIIYPQIRMRRATPVCLLLVLATVAAYWPVHQAGFLNFDDNQYITNNPRVFQGLTTTSVEDS